MLQKLEILGVDITNASADSILEYIFKSLKNSTEKYYVVTPNPEILVYALTHPEYKRILNEAEIALPDGVGIIQTGKVLGKPFLGRITGTDFMELLCKEGVRKRVSIGLLGGRGDVAEKAADCLRKMYPGINIVFISENPPDVSNGKWKLANGKLIDILFVAFGHPKQEEWISKNLDKIPVKVAMGVGGAFDYISGNVSRAPKMLRTLGLEWLYRLIRQPWRWRRQLALVKFTWLVVKQKLLGSANKAS